VGPRPGLDMVVRRERLCPCYELNPNLPAHSLVTTLFWFLIDGRIILKWNIYMKFLTIHCSSSITDFLDTLYLPIIFVFPYHLFVKSSW